jgi:hypothetical protein
VYFSLLKQESYNSKVQKVCQECLLNCCKAVALIKARRLTWIVRTTRAGCLVDGIRQRLERLPPFLVTVYHRQHCLSSLLSMIVLKCRAMRLEKFTTNKNFCQVVFFSRSPVRLCNCIKLYFSCQALFSRIVASIVLSIVPQIKYFVKYPTNIFSTRAGRTGTSRHFPSETTAPCGCRVTRKFPRTR